MPAPPLPAQRGLPAQVEGVSKWFGDLAALDRVDLAVAPGSVHGLVGPNGAGKTTLLSILFGLLRPDEGSVRLFGRTSTDSGSAWLDGVGGFVESPRFYPYLSGRANLAVLAGLDRGDARSLVDESLDLVGLGAARDRKVRGYSLGMRQRLGLAAAIIRRPRLLVLDEPTSGLDPAGVAALHVAVRSLAARGMSVLFSSHDISGVDALCDAVTVLNRGAVVFSGDAVALRAQAPDPVWQLRTSDDHAATRMAAASGVRLIATSDGPDDGTDDGGLRVTTDSDALDGYVIALGRAGVAVRQLEQVASPLQTLMLRLTGEPGAAPRPDVLEHLAGPS